jgi:hypothetical protein
MVDERWKIDDGKEEGFKWFEDGLRGQKRAINGEVQMSNIKCQLKSQCLMPNFEFCHMVFGIDLSLNTQSSLSLLII